MGAVELIIISDAIHNIYFTYAFCGSGHVIFDVVGTQGSQKTQTMKVVYTFVFSLFFLTVWASCPISHSYDDIAGTITFDTSPQTATVGVDTDNDGVSDYTLTQVSGDTYALPAGFPTSPVPTLYSLDFAGTVCSYNQLLPVELLYFRVNGDVLEWATASEENNSHFEVERSVDGRDFLAIGKVEGNGTTSERNEYKYNIPQGAAYYRLKQVDFDGAYEYSDVVFSRGDVDEFTVFPTFFSDVSELKANQPFTLYDLSGQKCEPISSGIYLARCEYGQVVRIMKK